MKIFMSAFLVLFAYSTFASVPTTFTEQAFSVASQNSAPVVVGFHSDSCGSCKIQKPNLDAILQEAEFSGVTGLKANFEETSSFRKSLKQPVRGPSAIVIFKNGNEVARINGVTQKDKIRKLLKEAISKNN